MSWGLDFRVQVSGLGIGFKGLGLVSEQRALETLGTYYGVTRSCPCPIYGLLVSVILKEISCELGQQGCYIVVLVNVIR